MCTQKTLNQCHRTKRMSPKRGRGWPRGPPLSDFPSPPRTLTSSPHLVRPNHFQFSLLPGPPSNLCCAPVHIISERSQERRRKREKPGPRKVARGSKPSSAQSLENMKPRGPNTLGWPALAISRYGLSARASAHRVPLWIHSFLHLSVC